MTRNRFQPRNATWNGLGRMHRPGTLVLAIVTCLGQGCGATAGATIALATSLDQASVNRTVASLKAKQREEMDSLRAKGDPFGDSISMRLAMPRDGSVLAASPIRLPSWRCIARQRSADPPTR